MKFPPFIPIGCQRADTGEPLEDLHLPTKLYIELRREARKLGKSFSDHLTQQVAEAFGLVKGNSEIRARLVASLLEGSEA